MNNFGSKENLPSLNPRHNDKICIKADTEVYYM